MKNRKSFRGHQIVLNMILLVVVAALLVFIVVLVRNKLLQNAQSLGNALVHSYAVEEEMSINSLEREVELVSQYVDELSGDGGGFDAIQSWLSGHFSKLIQTLGPGMVDLYAVVDGQIVAANPWEGDKTYQYQDTDWYRQAVEAGGDVVCGEVYDDAVTGQRIFTISKALNDRGDVFAMDVYIQNPAFHNTAQTLPEDCSYYLCDSGGTLLYSVTKWEASPQALQSYADFMLAGIADGSLLAYDASFEDMEGVTRGVYCQTMENGWTVMMTIPINSILIGERNTVVYVIAATAAVTFLALAFMSVRDAVRSRRMKRADDTAHMLGDSFYAIYRVNFVDGTYETFKTYDNLQSNIPRCGAYSQLLEAICSVVRPRTFRLFEESFSLESIRQRVAQGIADHGGDYQRRFGDTYRWVNIRTLYNPELIRDEVILCFRDVDAEKRREMQHTIILQEALDEARKSTKAKAEFFSRMSHDMRTPLNAIIGCCSLAEKSHVANDKGKVWEYIKKIEFSGNQLLGLINDILELSRMEAGKNNLDQRELDLGQLLTNIADIFRDQAQEEGKTLEVSLDFRESNVVGDEKKISQIVNNLLSNAVKYSNPGDTIRLEARQFDFQEHSKYQIVVEDTGIGMSPSFLKHLFDPYSRETAFSSHPTVGTGLGMAIVKSLVQQMSGEISVDSTLGKGSRFTVTLPLKTIRKQETAKPGEPELEAVPFEWTKRRVLLAEDNTLNREIAAEILRQLGAQVLTAVNGAEAVRIFRAEAPYSIDVILMDMQMPEMDGCQAAAAIRRLDRPDAAGIPMIAVTANAFAEDIDRTTKAGMNDHISKPIDPAILRKTMEKLMAAWDTSRNMLRRQDDGRKGT